ncbi:MAG: DUF1730 domain-containing protein, partial [Thermoanaerobaculum sp.]|nr:DUF1730 domain-containing protein [Thermoanaerobaculum sp.]
MFDPTILPRLAHDHGFTACGVVSVGPTPRHEAYLAWLAQDYAAEMTYLARPAMLFQRSDKNVLWPDARSVLVLAASYLIAEPPPLPPNHGRIARYAWGEDYHRWMGRRLQNLLTALHEALGPFRARWYV